MALELFQGPFGVPIVAALVLSTFFTLFLLTLPSRYQPHSDLNRFGSTPGATKDVSVQIVVLGDIGRSPRMQYHALSVAKHGGSVEIIGYHGNVEKHITDFAGQDPLLPNLSLACNDDIAPDHHVYESDPHPDIYASQNVKIIPLSPSPKALQTSNRLLFLAFAPIKVLWQVLSLYYALGYKSRASKWMIVQNPPSIPTLAVALVICFFRNTKLIIDWHNFGYSILALKLGPAHPLVNISQQYEQLFARAASYHLTVTYAMARVLKESFGVTALPLHDRPPAHFQPLSQTQRSEFLKRLPETAPYANSIQDGSLKLIVSSTSWTPDEDFSLLLDALVAYSAQAAQDPRLPHILAIITGKGPQKDQYLSKIAELKADYKLAKVEIQTAWLSMDEYAHLLGSADLGISLHTSSSGVDLPMKVVDMFGTGLPVFGWSKFKAWPELVKENVNGKGFGSAQQLTELLFEYFKDDEKLQKLREGAMKECKRRWDGEWDPIAGRLLRFVE